MSSTPLQDVTTQDIRAMSPVEAKAYILNMVGYMKNCQLVNIRTAGRQYHPQWSTMFASAGVEKVEKQLDKFVKLMGEI